MDKKPFVYIAGPISKGPYWVNVRNGVDAHRKVLELGGIPFCPMLDFLYVLVYPETTWQDCMDYDFQVIMRCDAMIRLPGESKGADQEEKFAQDKGIPFFNDWDKLAIWINNYGKKDKHCCRYNPVTGSEA